MNAWCQPVADPGAESGVSAGQRSGDWAPAGFEDRPAAGPEQDSGHCVQLPVELSYCLVAKPKGGPQWPLLTNRQSLTLTPT
jgi:hypothetical protein